MKHDCLCEEVSERSGDTGCEERSKAIFTSVSELHVIEEDCFAKNARNDNINVLFARGQ